MTEAANGVGRPPERRSDVVHFAAADATRATGCSTLETSLWYSNGIHQLLAAVRAE